MLAAMISIMLLGMSAGNEPDARNRPQDPDQIICRAPEPVLGSRVARRRICRTRAEWQAFEEDRHQLRRDLNNAGNCAGSSSCSFD